MSEQIIPDESHDQTPFVPTVSPSLWPTIPLTWEKALYLLIFVIAIISRFWGLGDRVVSHDESLHTQYSYQYYIGDGYQHSPLMHGPMVFHTAALSYWLFGAANDFTARVPAAIFGIILIFLPYLLRGWIGKRGALFASFLFLISPYITYYSRYIREDIFTIVGAMILFIALCYYLRDPQNKYLSWFALGMVTMFLAKEVSFIYVGIFGSFLLIRLGLRLLASDWFWEEFGNLILPIIIFAVALLMIGGGFLAQRAITEPKEEGTATAESTGFAADPTETTTPEEIASPVSETVFRWLQVAGIGLLIASVLLFVRQLRPNLDHYPETDLIILFSTLVLPSVMPLLVVISGRNPTDYTLNQCVIEGTIPESLISQFFLKLVSGSCWSAFFTSPIVYSLSFTLVALVVTIFIGLWWNARKWVVPALIFHSVFLIFYTSVFTNPQGWITGKIGSLGYWLAQQEVQRGSQPWFYYFFVMPFYEFLPVLLTFLAIGLWAKRKQLHWAFNYWFATLVGGALLSSLINWWYDAPLVAAGEKPSYLIGIQVFLFILVVLGLFWFFVVQPQMLRRADAIGLSDLIHQETTNGFVPLLVWWLLLTFVAYGVAGEKMPWLSSHFVPPMALLGGWYFQHRFAHWKKEDWLNRQNLLLLGLTVAILIALTVALSPIWLGQLKWGVAERLYLNHWGRFIGGLLLVGGLSWLWWRVGQGVSAGIRASVWSLALLFILSSITIRFTYMANFPNADYTNEYLVYAHGAPPTKDVVLKQLEELSLRLHGDRSIKVAFDNVSSWPYLWYLRDYPNRLYFGETPGRNVTEYPVIIVGDSNWSKIEPLVGDDYEMTTHTFLWWPMEEYRKFSWNALLGDQLVPAEQRRGLGNSAIREALWNIFWYRDYTKYGEIFGGKYSFSEWPLRRPLRLYIRKDVYAQLWDYGAGAFTYEPPVDPYAEGELIVNATTIIGNGQLNAPRNLAITADGTIYVADSGSHRIAVFNSDGTLINNWGGFGTAPGKFNEPWGVAVDDQYLYVADTWNHRVQKFTLDGQFVQQIGQGGTPGSDQEGGGLFFGPRGILLLPDNRLLVTDTGNHRFQLFDRNGTFIRQTGGLGSLLGQMYEPVGIGFAPQGDVFLADTWNERVQRFTADLIPIGEWTVEAWKGESINNKPYIAIDSNGRIYITDPEEYRVLIFNEGGQYLGRFGQFGVDNASFGLPVGIAVDSQNNVYVADSVNNRILKFDAATIGGQAPILQEGE